MDWIEKNSQWTKNRNKENKTSFYQNALSSKRPMEKWKTIQRISNPSPTRIKSDPNNPNQHFNTTPQRLANTTAKSPNKLKNFV